MTINGGKPHAAGDLGQRYEVTFLNEKGERKTLGWCSTRTGVESFCRAVEAHPSWSVPQVVDRRPEDGAP